MSTDQTYTGRCFCGATAFTVSGEPALMGYCHCASCRQWSNAPVSAFSLWNPDAVRVTAGADGIGSSQRTANSLRKWCRKCGGHLFTEHPAIGLTEVCAALIPEMEFAPTVHVHYQETVLHMRDGLPKMRDVPTQAGGSGIELPD